MKLPAILIKVRLPKRHNNPQLKFKRNLLVNTEQGFAASNTSPTMKIFCHWQPFYSCNFMSRLVSHLQVLVWVDPFKAQTSMEVWPGHGYLGVVQMGGNVNDWPAFAFCKRRLTRAWPLHPRIWRTIWFVRLPSLLAICLQTHIRQVGVESSSLRPDISPSDFVWLCQSLPVLELCIRFHIFLWLLSVPPSATCRPLSVMFLLRPKWRRSSRTPGSPWSSLSSTLMNVGTVEPSHLEWKPWGANTQTSNLSRSTP